MARDQGNWPAAACFYRKLLEHEPQNAALWLQQGHMLKESGLLIAARRHYERAIQLDPLNPEPLAQMAILAKIRGDFRGAAALFQQALSSGFPQPDFIRGELEFLRRSGPPASARGAGSDVIFFLSSVSKPASEEDPTELKHFLGSANYSYSYVMRGYQAALEAAGFTCRVIETPEFLPDIKRSFDGIAVHIGFYPPDGPRFLKGAYNIICVAWEFERLRAPTELLSYHAFSDPALMLKRADEVWAISGYGADAIRRSNIAHVREVSTPVPVGRATGRAQRPGLGHLHQVALKLDRLEWTPLAVGPGMQSTLTGQAHERRGSLLNWLIDADHDNQPVLFYCVFNVHDFRKQMKPMLEAFVQFVHANPTAFLLLKISCVDSDKLDINTMMFMDQISDAGEMTPPLVSDHVLMTTDTLTRSEMNLLADISSYYICTSSAEGQNLPLIEAMGRGVVPVSVDHTAMRDYISPSNAVVIASEFRPVTPRLASRYGMYGISTHHVAAGQVYEALEVALAHSQEQYATFSNSALETALHRFSSEPLIAAARESQRLAASRVSVPPL